MFKSLSRPFRVSKSLRFVLVQTENTANSHCGLFKKLETDENLLELLLPRVTACRHSHTCHHTQRVAKEPISYASVAYQQDLCGKPFYPLVISQRYYALDSSTDDKKSKESSKILSEKDEKSDELEGDKEDKPKGIMARFKEAYKEYGKALIGVHVVTSACWFGSFYFAAANGLDVVPLLEAIGASEKVIKAFQLPGVGNAAVAYLCYKVATPLRYTVTILGTQLTVKYMRRWGYWQPIKPEDSIRALVREGSENVKEKVKDRIDDVKDDMKDKITEMRGDMKDKYEDWKDKKKEDLKDWSEKKGEDIKEKVTDWTQSVKDRSHDVVQKSKKVMRNIEDRGKMDRFK